MGYQWIAVTLWLMVMTGITGEQGFQIEEFEKSPGLYYVDRGTVQLYNTVWKTIIYVNLREEDMEVNSVGTYIDHVERLCNSVEVKKLDRLRSI